MKAVDLTGFDWIWFSFLLIVVVGASLQMPKYWRGELVQLYERGSGGWWPFGEALRRGFLRSIHLGVVGGFWVLASLFFLSLRDNVGAGLAQSALEALGVVSAAMFFVTLILDLLVVLLNRPKFLVPPPYRDDVGAVRVWCRPRHGDVSRN